MAAETMQALKIIVMGEVTSFRHPHTMIGTQLTYEMPPPATIYGHICSAVGYPIASDTLQWAYHFQYDTRFMDYEHTHFFGKGKPKMNPTQRQLLFRPKLTLYVSDVTLYDYFSHPRYPVVLGRSQDVMTYTDVREIQLHRSSTAYFDGTLLPTEFPYTGRGIQPTGAMQMPRFINQQRQVNHAVYRFLPHTAHPRIWNGHDKQVVWVDPDTGHPRNSDVKRAVVWHTWID